LAVAVGRCRSLGCWLFLVDCWVLIRRRWPLLFLESAARQSGVGASFGALRPQSMCMVVTRPSLFLQLASYCKNLLYRFLSKLISLQKRESLPNDTSMLGLNDYNVR